VQPDTAGSVFGNKEQITSVMFDPVIGASPVKADFVSEGKLFDTVAFAATGGGATVTSKSCRMVAHPSASTIKSFYIQSTQAGNWKLQVMLDESELVTGAPVWRDYAVAAAVAANTLVHADVEGLFRQARVVFVNTSGSVGTVDAWAFSVQ